MPASYRTNSVCLFHWGAARTYLLYSIFPDAVRLGAKVGDSCDTVLARIPGATSHFIFHTDLTDSAQLPTGRRRLATALRAKGVCALNAHLTNISKHRVQDECETLGLNTTRTGRRGNPDQLVIVKTSANYGGEPERQLTAHQRALLGLPAPNRWIRGHDGYQIVRRADVPPEFWQSASLIVERYIDNARQSFFRAHVLGDHMVLSRAVTPRRIKKMPAGLPPDNRFYRISDMKLRRPRAKAPHRAAEVAARFCTGFKLEFGSVDIVHDDRGECYVIDVSATPNWGRPHYAEMFSFLAKGLPTRST